MRVDYSFSKGYNSKYKCSSFQGRCPFFRANKNTIKLLKSELFIHLFLLILLKMLFIKNHDSRMYFNCKDIGYEDRF